MTPTPTATDDGPAQPTDPATPGGPGTPAITAPAVEAGPFYDESTEPGVPRTRKTGPFIATKEYRRFTEHSDAALYASLARSRTAFYTPTTTCIPKQLEQDLDQLLTRIDICVAEHRRTQTTLPVPLSVSHRGTPQVVDLLIVDEAERLTPPPLEHLRDRFDAGPPA